MVKVVVGVACGLLLGILLGRGGEASPQFCPEGSIPREASFEVEWMPGTSGRSFACFTGDDQETGPTVTWLGSDIWQVGKIERGQLNGPLYRFDSSTGLAGQISVAIDGEIRDSVAWNNQGILTSRLRFVDESRNVLELWYEDGSRKQRSESLGDELDGQTERWLATGRKVSEGRYDLGKRAGEWICWNDKGDENVAARYDHGELISSTYHEGQGDWAKTCFSGCGTKDATDSVASCGSQNELASTASSS